MFLSVVQSEWFKFRKSGMLPVLFVGPAIGLMIGLMTNITGMEADVNAWYLLLQFMILPYALLFLPLMTGVLAGLICRYEHQAGGWKQFLSLPVTRGSVFFTKYLLLIASVFIIQMLFLGAVYMAGVMKGIADPFPMMIIWKSVLGGWVATFPLVALQLWMSTVWKSFAAPFAVNVIFTLPSILAVNSEQFGPYYPWGQPFLMMYAGRASDSVFYVPWDQVLTVVGGSLLVFFAAGLVYFQRKEV
ncbi:ABC transporter permease [Lentibacillus juripiscarius]|uniref:ABC transporter permease n=1 Tax=Lentibacillus juripiscarius TaxID=257446 RepID=A0ABW5VAP3_9BACI